MKQISLTGLRPDLPISVMAAFGLLRICSRLLDNQEPRLAWVDSGSGLNAALQTKEKLSHNELIAVLLKGISETVKCGSLNWTDQLKLEKVMDFADKAKKALDASTCLKREEADWFASFGSDLVKNDEGELRTTPFDMSVARQKFPSDAIKLGSSLMNDEKSRDYFHEAVFGPWKYADDQHSFGWDPTTMKMGAFTHKAPTGMANTGVRAVVWLAFESIPLFPCFYSHGMLATRGLQFKRDKRQLSLCWPIWNGAIDLSELKSLLSWPGILDDKISPEEAKGRGLLAIYRSVQFKPNKYLACFRPPELVYAAALGAR
jgi:hypothetical protein